MMKGNQNERRMKRHRWVGCVLLLVFFGLASQPSSAQETGNIKGGVFWSIGGGVGKADTTFGMSMGLSFTARSKWAQLSVAPADFVLYSGDTSPYYSEELSDGRTVCRNGDNGQFASRSNCVSIAAIWVPSADLGLRVPSVPVFVGAGMRYFNETSSTYGSLVAYLDKEGLHPITLRANVGRDYMMLTLSWGWMLSSGASRL